MDDAVLFSRHGTNFRKRIEKPPNACDALRPSRLSVNLRFWPEHHRLLAVPTDFHRVSAGYFIGMLQLTL